MSPRPLVSVVIPTSADRARRLQSALASAWAQEGLGDQFDQEVIVVDDASTGPTEEVVRRFPGTRYVRLETSSGASAARNAGLAEATGHYVAFLDDDDLWLPNKFSRQVAALERSSETEVAYSQRFQCESDGSSGGVYPGSDAPSGWVFEAAIRTGGIAQISQLLVPREAIERVGRFAENLRRAEETEFSTRLALHFPFRFVPGIVSILLPSPDRRSIPGEVVRRALLTKRDNLLACIQGHPNEAGLRELVVGATSWLLVQRAYRSGERDEARRELLHWIAESGPFDSDAWTRARFSEMVSLLAAGAESPAERASFCRDVKRAAAPSRLKDRIEMRRLVADVWTDAALRPPSGGGRDRKTAASAAVRAIAEYPLKPLSRPGLLRVAGRAITDLDRRSGREHEPDAGGNGHAPVPR
jgi:glycosyltransferase involved in cell wall biosynthesis